MESPETTSGLPQHASTTFNEVKDNDTPSSSVVGQPAEAPLPPPFTAPWQSSPTPRLVSVHPTTGPTQVLTPTISPFPSPPPSLPSQSSDGGWDTPDEGSPDREPSPSQSSPLGHSPSVSPTQPTASRHIPSSPPEAEAKAEESPEVASRESGENEKPSGTSSGLHRHTDVTSEVGVEVVPDRDDGAKVSPPPPFVVSSLPPLTFRQVPPVQPTPDPTDAPALSHSPHPPLAPSPLPWQCPDDRSDYPSEPIPLPSLQVGHPPIEPLPLLMVPHLVIP